MTDQKRIPVRRRTGIQEITARIPAGDRGEGGENGEPMSVQELPGGVVHELPTDLREGLLISATAVAAQYRP